MIQTRDFYIFDIMQLPITQDAKWYWGFYCFGTWLKLVHMYNLRYLSGTLHSEYICNSSCFFFHWHDLYCHTSMNIFNQGMSVILCIVPFHYSSSRNALCFCHRPQKNLHLIPLNNTECYKERMKEKGTREMLCTNKNRM